MVIELYNDIDARSKAVGDMDRKDRQNVLWDIAEEYKVNIYFLLQIFLPCRFFN